jgi:hypothetical protein
MSLDTQPLHRQCSCLGWFGLALLLALVSWWIGAVSKCANGVGQFGGELLLKMRRVGFIIF